MFPFKKKPKPPEERPKADRPRMAVPGLKQSLLSLEQRLMFDAAAAATASEVASEQVAQEQAEAAVSSDASHEDSGGEKGSGQDVVHALTTYMPAEGRAEVAFVDPTVPNYQELLGGMDPNIEVIMLDGGQDGIEQMANALSGRTGIDAIHVISHGEAGELQLGTGVLNADSMSTQYADDLAVIQQSLSEQADILVYGCEFAQGETGQAAVDMLAELTGADVQASNDLTGSISLGGDWEFEVSTGTIETSLAVDYDAQMNWAEVLGNETIVDTFSDKSYGNNDGTSSWSSNWTEVDRGGSDADGGHIQVNSGELRIQTQVAGASVSRGVDLSGARSATLSFDYENDLDKGGAVEVRISTDGGANYRTLTDGTFSKTSHTGSGTVRLDISDHLSADTKIQFVVTGTSGGDRLFIDNVQVDYNVADVNTAPTDLALSSNSVAEQASTGTVVGTVTGTDVDAGDTKTYSLTDTAGGRFAIDPSTGVLTVADGSLLNYESAASHTVTVQVTDSGGQSYTESFSIALTNVNEGPTGANAAVILSEDAAHTLTVANFGFSDVDAGDSLSAVRIDTLPTAGSLTLSGVAVTAGQVVSAADITAGRLVFSPAANARGTGYASVTFSVQDSHSTYDAAPNTLTFNVIAVNDAPTDLALSVSTVAEHATTGTVVGTVSGTDPDASDTKTYSLTDTAGGRFAIDPSTGVLTVADGSLLNYEAAASHSVTVQVTDSGGQSYTETFTINLTNVNEGPSDLALSANSVAEHATTGTVVGTVSGTDLDAGDTKTYSLTDTAGGRFAIDASTGVLTVADGSLLNYEPAASHSVTVQVTDSGGQSYTETFTINLTNVNEWPSDLSLSASSVAENAVTGTVVGTVSGSDPDTSDTKTYSLTDTAGGRFAINASTGEITVADGSLLNYGAAANHSVTVQVTDSEGQTYRATFSIALTNVSHADETPDFKGLPGSFVPSQPLASDGNRAASGSLTDVPGEKGSGLLFPEDRRKMVEIRTEGPPTVQPITPKTTGLKFVHEEFHSKPALPVEEKELLLAPVERSEDEIRDRSEDTSGSALLDSEPLDGQQPERAHESAFGTAMTVGLAGLVLQGSGGAKEKLVAVTRRLRTPVEGASPDMTSEQSSEDEARSPSHESAQEAPTSNTPAST